LLDQGTQQPQQGIEVQHEETDGHYSSAGIRQLGHHSLQGAFAFGVAKFPFDGDAIRFVLALLFFSSLVNSRGRPSGLPLSRMPRSLHQAQWPDLARCE
jgi:hypothetical protein